MALTQGSHFSENKISRGPELAVSVINRRFHLPHVG